MRYSGIVFYNWKDKIAIFACAQDLIALTKVHDEVLTFDDVIYNSTLTRHIKI